MRSALACATRKALLLRTALCHAEGSLLAVVQEQTAQITLSKLLMNLQDPTLCRCVVWCPAAAAHSDLTCTGPRRPLSKLVLCRNKST